MNLLTAFQGWCAWDAGIDAIYNYVYANNVLLEFLFLDKRCAYGNRTPYAYHVVMGNPDTPRVYSPQAQDVRAKNNYVTALTFSADEYCVITAEAPAGFIVPLHSHADRETFYVLSGEMSFYDGVSWRVLKQGECVDVVDSMKHAWHNASNSAASLLIVTTVRMGLFLQQVSSPVETGLDAQKASTQKEHFLS